MQVTDADPLEITAVRTNLREVIRITCEREARQLAERAVETGVANGRNPAGVAAGCVYAAAGGPHRPARGHRADRPPDDARDRRDHKKGASSVGRKLVVLA